MPFEYEDWLDQRLGKPVVWAKTAWGKLLSREISTAEIKDCILFGEKEEVEYTPTGTKIIVEKELHETRFEALVVVYVDTPTHYKVISNHLRRRKRKWKGRT